MVTITRSAFVFLQATPVSRTFASGNASVNRLTAFSRTTGTKLQSMSPPLFCGVSTRLLCIFSPASCSALSTPAQPERDSSSANRARHKPIFFISRSLL